jgi:hypothetical protein
MAAERALALVPNDADDDVRTARQLTYAYEASAADGHHDYLKLARLMKAAAARDVFLKERRTSTGW